MENKLTFNYQLAAFDMLKFFQHYCINSHTYLNMPEEKGE